MASSTAWQGQRARLASGGGDPGRGTLPHLLSTVLGTRPKHPSCSRVHPLPYARKFVL